MACEQPSKSIYHLGPYFDLFPSMANATYINIKGSSELVPGVLSLSTSRFGGSLVYDTPSCNLSLSQVFEDFKPTCST